ncbi:unnamed protein product [Chironomus riparius]|uniref:Uncharacterized protein n=1 Tax=Chironomus riparius TaxID=315576 RepID=A0A9N9S2Y5_9DIPT|nr:unnamed protein product [Chironomus riparius]
MSSSVKSSSVNSSSVKSSSIKSSSVKSSSVKSSSVKSSSVKSSSVKSSSVKSTSVESSCIKPNFCTTSVIAMPSRDGSRGSHEHGSHRPSAESEGSMHDYYEYNYECEYYEYEDGSSGNVINLEMTQQSSDEPDYENETAMKIDETMVKLRQSTIEPDAELIMISSKSDDDVKRRKRQVEEIPPNEVPEDNPNEMEPTNSESFTPAIDEQTDEEPSVNLEVETSITKSPTTTFIGGIPLSVITRQPNMTATTTTTATQSSSTTTRTTVKGKVTYYTKKPLIFRSETTTSFTVGPLVRQQATGLTFASQKAKMAAPTTRNMKLVSTTRKVFNVMAPELKDSSVKAPATQVFNVTEPQDSNMKTPATQVFNVKAAESQDFSVKAPTNQVFYVKAPE